MARYSIRHDPLAVEELQKAADWLERQTAGVGAVFTAAVKNKLAEIVSSPRRWAREKDGTRHALLRRFKYIIIFREKGRIIEIIAYAHTADAPAIGANASGGASELLSQTVTGEHLTNPSEAWA